MKKQKMRKATAICLALGMTFMSMGQAFANEGTQTTEATSSVEWIDETEVETELEPVTESEVITEPETETPENEISESEIQNTEVSETREMEETETETQEVETEVTIEEEITEAETEEVIDQEEDVVSQGVFFNDSLSEEQREQVLEEISQIERPENYLAGTCNSQEECVSYLRGQMSWHYQYIEFKLYSNTYYADNGRANLWHDFLDKAWEHTGVSYEGDSIRYDYNAYNGGSVACEILGSNRYQYTFIYRIPYKSNTEQEQALRVAVRNKTAELCKGASSDYEKIRRIYDFICKTVSFDHTHGESYFLRYTAYAAMMNHTSVCQGYATLFYRMCLEAGIDARVVTSRSLGHSWNIVRLGNVYYYVDAAWDEYASKKSALKKNLNWFLKSSADFPDHGNDKEVMSLMPLSSYPMSQKSYSVPKEDRMYVGLYSVNDTWYYFEGENINRNFSDLCLYNGNWYYVQNGVLNWNYTGLARHSGSWYYVKNGCVDWNYTGLTQYYGTWYYVQKGMLKWSYTGLTKYNGTWYYIENSVLTWRYYGLIQYGRKWYYIEKSCLNWDYTGLVLHNDDWYYVQNGILNMNYSGLTRYNKKWYYVEKGVLNWAYTGLTQYYGTWYYIEKGVLNWTYTGLTNYYGTWYYMEQGVLNWGYTGLTNFHGTWYYVEKGVLNWDYTGFTDYYGTRYYVKNSVMSWNYTTFDMQRASAISDRFAISPVNVGRILVMYGHKFSSSLNLWEWDGESTTWIFEKIDGNSNRKMKVDLTTGIGKLYYKEIYYGSVNLVTKQVVDGSSIKRFFSNYVPDNGWVTRAFTWKECGGTSVRIGGVESLGKTDVQHIFGCKNSVTVKHIGTNAKNRPIFKVTDEYGNPLGYVVADSTYNYFDVYDMHCVHIGASSVMS